MNDVARLAGVSVGSVSNVLNGVKVKPSTLDKVNNAIKELQYEPNNLARSFKMNQTNTIALILPSIWHPFFSSIAFFVEQIAKKNGYHVYLCNSNSDIETEIAYIEMLRKNKVDGIIAITYADIDSYVEGSLPFVSIDRHFDQDISIVSSDNYEGGRLAAHTLVEKGAESLLFIGSHNIVSNETMRRREGFEAYCKQKNIDYQIIDIQEPHNDYRKELRKIMQNNPNIDGIFAINDFVALDIMEELTSLGKEVLSDYQLIGFDGIKMSMERDFKVSTIVQSTEDIANNAFELLIKQIKDPNYHEQIIIPVQFVDGGTTRK